MGYHRAGFTDITGIDIKPQPRYPFRFIQADALEYLACFWPQYDVIHASPPCQDYMQSGMMARGRHPRLVEQTRIGLQAIGKPFVLENVPGAPLRPSFVLCGSMFGLGVRRHRHFETRDCFALTPATCDHSRPITGVFGHPHGARGAWKGQLPSNAETWSRAMGIDWMQPKELAQAIPPAYTEFIGRQLLAQLGDAR